MSTETTPQNTANKLPVELVTIEKLVYEGWGLGRLANGQIVFAPFTAPGDTIEGDIPTGKPPRVTSYELMTPAPERILPQCEHFSVCGGCHWQHLPISEQTTWKHRIVEESFTRLAKLPNTTIHPVIQSPQSYGYRNHIRWHVLNTNGNSLKLGFKAPQSDEIIPIEQCHLVPEPINRLKYRLDHFLSQLLSAKNTTPLAVDCRWNDDGEILVLLELPSPPEQTAPLEKLASALGNDFKLAGLAWTDAREADSSIHLVDGIAAINTRINKSLSLQVSMGAFFQANSSMLEIFQQRVLAEIPEDSNTILEVYAGGGFFSIPIAQAKPNATITAIEVSELAAEDARCNAETYNLSNITRYEADAYDALKHLSSESKGEARFDTCLIDPPRSGCNKGVLKHISDLTSGTIIYVSCNPSTLSRDCAWLINEGQWRLRDVQPLDLFPQTYHIECIAVLEK